MKNRDESIRYQERHYNIPELEKYGRKILRRNFSKVEAFEIHSPPYDSDDKIRQNVMESLYRSTLVDSSKIEVLVHDGEVDLEGSVRTQTEKKIIDEIIKFIPGIVIIHNDLIVSSELGDINTF